METSITMLIHDPSTSADPITVDIVQKLEQFAIAKTGIGFQVFHIESGLRIPQLTERKSELITNARILLEGLSEIPKAYSRTGWDVEFGKPPRSEFIDAIKAALESIKTHPGLLY